MGLTGVAPAPAPAGGAGAGDAAPGATPSVDSNSRRVTSQDRAPAMAAREEDDELLPPTVGCAPPDTCACAPPVVRCV
jgi:hypothetical protein